jgi:Transglutaminase-like superfamily
MTPQPHQFSLSPHVFVCQSGSLVVLLDLKRDRYEALRAKQAAELSSLIPGWPVQADAGAVTEKSYAVAKALLDKGLLLEGATSGKNASPVKFASPKAELTPDLRTRGSLLIAFLICMCAWASAKTALRLGRLQVLVKRVQRRNEQHSHVAAIELETVRGLLATFKAIRPLLFASRDACVLESFVLCEFLSLHGIYPAWVFGVKTDPWGAHCWLQIDDSVLNIQNNSAEEASRYAPIMVAGARVAPTSQ